MIFWSGDRIQIIALEHWEYQDNEKFHEENLDITKEMYEQMMVEYPEEEW